MAARSRTPSRSAIPSPRGPENGPDLAPWSPARRHSPTQRGIRWLDTPSTDTRTGPDPRPASTPSQPIDPAGDSSR